MKELFEAAISPANIIPTFLLAFVVLYWLTVIIGVLDLDSLDFDQDMDVDMDADVDIDTDVSTGASIGWLNHVLAFFNLGQIPLMVFLTFLIIPMWALSMLANDFLGNSTFVIGLLLLIPIFLVCLFVAKFLTIPFIKIFAAMDKGAAIENAVGKMCVVLMTTTQKRLGQASVKIDGAPLMLNVKSTKGELKKGDSALVIDFIKNKNYYLIEPIENLEL